MTTITIKQVKVDELADLRNLRLVIDGTEKTYEQSPEAKANWHCAVVYMARVGDIIKDKTPSAIWLSQVMRVLAWSFIGKAENAYRKLRQVA
jgi:hypothetical protein